jgi:tripartite-type tricarboxylate transporter receptor subunit TctC
VGDIRRPGLLQGWAVAGARLRSVFPFFLLSMFPALPISRTRIGLVAKAVRFVGFSAKASNAVSETVHGGLLMAHARSPALRYARIATVAAIGVAGAQLLGLAHAQQKFPSKPIRIVVPFTPGGTSDVLARMIGVKMSENWGQPVVIETRTGASGSIGAGLVAKATPDGHTLLITSAAFTISAALHQNLPYDAVKDFSGVTRLGYSTTALLVPPALGVKTVNELVALAKAKPGYIIFSHAGVGSSTHMSGERFRLAAGITVRHVGFKGGTDAMIEVLAGRVHYAIVGLAASLPHIKEGKLVALALGTPQRSPLLPDVPTIAETLPGYARDGSHAMLAPAGTPRPILNQISREVARIFELPEIKERLKNFDFVAATTTPEEHNKVIRADIETFSGVVKLAGLRPK